MARHVHELSLLTIREIDVLRLVAQGMSAREVAHHLSIATSTVERHVENARLKTRTRNRAHTVAYVIQLGILDQDPNDSSARMPLRVINGTGKE